MTVVRRSAAVVTGGSAAGVLAAGILAGGVLLGGTAWAQEDPCTPGPDGSVPEMCSTGPTEPALDEPRTTEPGKTQPGTTDPSDPCLGSRPQEPGDGQVVDGGTGSEPGTAEPGQTESAPAEAQPAEEQPAEEPAAQTEPEQSAEEPTTGSPDDPVEAPAQEQPSTDDPSVVCAFGVPGSTGGGAESAAGGRDTAGRAPTLAQLPRTGPHDRVVAAALVGSGLVLAGAVAAVAGRRRTTA